MKRKVQVHITCEVCGKTEVDWDYPRGIKPSVGGVYRVMGVCSRRECYEHLYPTPPRITREVPIT